MAHLRIVRPFNVSAVKTLTSGQDVDGAITFQPPQGMIMLIEKIPICSNPDGTAQEFYIRVAQGGVPWSEDKIINKNFGASYGDAAGPKNLRRPVAIRGDLNVDLKDADSACTVHITLEGYLCVVDLDEGDGPKLTPALAEQAFRDFNRVRR